MRKSELPRSRRLPLPPRRAGGDPFLLSLGVVLTLAAAIPPPGAVIGAPWSQSSPAPPRKHGAPPNFADRAAAAGLDLVSWSGSAEKPHILESTGNGVLALDYDGDGFQDLYFVAAYRLPCPGSAGGEAAHPDRTGDTPGSRLYRNRGDGTFADVTARSRAGLQVYGHGGCVGDADGDGLPDLYVTAFGPNVLLRNRGDGTFEDATAEAGVGDPGWSIGCAFLDADLDGDHDLYVANYIVATWDDVRAARRTRRWRGRVEVMDGPRGLPAAADTFYRNEGGGLFREATAAAGLAAADAGYSMAVAAFDPDHDGDRDLYVANDSTPNHLFRNRGDGTFEEVGTRAGCAYNADGEVQGSMGIAVGDWDGNGWADLVVTNFAHDYYTLYGNLDGQLFQDDSFRSGLAVPTYVPLGWSAIFLDADRDADLDLFLANGHIYPQVDDDPALNESYRQPNQLFLNDGGRLREVSAAAGEGFAVVESSRGAAAFDLENDGDLDIAVSNQDARPTLLVDVGERPQGWLAADLAGPAGPPPLGARVSLWERGREAPGAVPQERQVVAGGSYASQSDLRVHFGLGPAGSARSAARLEVAWPGGRRQAFRELPGDRFYVIPPPPAADRRR